MHTETYLQNSVCRMYMIENPINTYRLLLHEMNSVLAILHFTLISLHLSCPVAILTPEAILTASLCLYLQPGAAIDRLIEQSTHPGPSSIN